jgi:hypothetical protein
LVVKKYLGKLWSIPGLVTTKRFPASTTEECSERTTIRESRGSHCKINEGTDRGILKCMYVCMYVRGGTEFIRPLHCDLRDVLCLSKNGFQERFQKLQEGWQKCDTAQGNSFEGNIT